MGREGEREKRIGLANEGTGNESINIFRFARGFFVEKLGRESARGEMYPRNF